MSEFVRKPLLAGTWLCESSTTFDCAYSLEALSTVSPVSNADTLSILDPNSQFQFARDGQNLGLTSPQCGVPFPGVFEDQSSCRYTPRDFSFERWSRRYIAWSRNGSRDDLQREGILVVSNFFWSGWADCLQVVCWWNIPVQFRPSQEGYRNVAVTLSRHLGPSRQKRNPQYRIRG